MKVIVAADIHEQGDLMNDILRKEGADVLLSCGDQQPYYEPPVPCYFVKGNHEDFALMQALENGYLFDGDMANLNLITPDSPVCAYQGSITVAGLGGIFNPRKFNGLDPRYFSKSDIQHLRRYAPSHVDVMLFHETLPLFNIVRRNKIMGCQKLENVVREVKPRMTFSGHHDEVLIEHLDGTVCVQLGKPSDSYVVLNVSNGIDSYQLKNPKENLSDEIKL